MTRLLAVAVGGALGSLARYGLNVWLTERLASRFPWGILAANTIGCLLIGVAYGLLLNHPQRPFWAALCITGFLGGFTTFSTFALDTVLAGRAGDWPVALGNIAASLVLGLAAAVLGLLLVRQ